jgi:aspartyl-tRNA(Asn)/glutamyl-tRNA(Gln) amidotransferase subunit C
MDIVGKTAKLTRQDVKHVAKLANLKLTSKDIDKFSKQLSEIVAYIDKLKKVDTSDVEPTSQTTGLENVTRNDERLPQHDLTQKQALSGTEEVHNGYFVVPMVLKKRQDN